VRPDKKMAMIEFVARDVMNRREGLAEHVRDALAAAGLSVVSSNMSTRLEKGGAAVQVDHLVDCHAPVSVSWRVDHLLMEAVMQAVKADRTDAPVFVHFGVVLEGMLRVIKEILISEGFEIRDSTNDFAPLSIEVLKAPERSPSWTTFSLLNDFDDQGPAH
jgi:hypothetical protein